MIVMSIMDLWNIVRTDWHKIILVILVLAHVWKFFFDYIWPTVHKKDETLSILIPKEGCTITITPNKNN